ncbi:hypothetical protein BLA23254_07053 [Burkholderia lata]|uniref:Uncharacterized protein n=1 Tax=Burkholderia lata (strain ATCC 17760 / DSM 23089 / LMG 22485 / NCIMB 9086 / R18194 / 383) TaxID=482957 RepID=A0A6P2RYI1_BURL3|nr:hypothetical protein [Burkholderia lata]VWC42121.1 hypothetical protein BLA23254_07053 [Burkholderia lata]
MSKPSPVAPHRESVDQPRPASKLGRSIPLNLAQARQLLECYGGLEGTIVLSLSSAGHSGAGVYAWIEDHPEEGASFLDPDRPFTATSPLIVDRDARIRQLQRALAFWMPSTTKDSHPYAHRAREHAALLAGFDEQTPERAGDRLLEFVERCNQTNERMLDALADAGCPEEMEAAEWIARMDSELTGLREERDLLASELVDAHVSERTLGIDAASPGTAPDKSERGSQLIFHLSCLMAGWKTRQPLDARFVAAERWMKEVGLIRTAKLMSDTGVAPVAGGNTPPKE